MIFRYDGVRVTTHFAEPPALCLEIIIVSLQAKLVA